MFLQLSNISIFIGLFTALVAVLIYEFLRGFYKFKKQSSQHLKVLSNEIQSQKTVQQQLKVQSEEATVKNQKLKKDLRQAHIEIINIHHSYQEITEELMKR
jgi:hypothetical protein